MSLSFSTRVVRGGSAVQTVYWRVGRPGAEEAPKLVKHGRIFVFQRQSESSLPASISNRLSRHHVQL